MRTVPLTREPVVPLSPLRRKLSVIWALVPLFTFGVGTVFIIGSAAVRVRRRGVRLAAVGYGVLFLAIVIFTPGRDELPREALRDSLAMWTWFGSQWVAGTIYAFRIRLEAFQPIGPAVSAFHPQVPHLPTRQPPPPRSDRSHLTQGSHARSVWDPWGAGPASASHVSGPGRVGAYALLRKLGEGGQGAVYLGQAPDGRQVAVKVLHEPVSGGPAGRDGFMGEVVIAQRVPPFATAPILDVGFAGDIAYIVSEYVSGPSLERLVREAGPLDGDSLTRLAIYTAAALKGIHGTGIVHRDFKPANILLGPDGPRVIDFGIAKALDRATTTTGGMKGTPAFMSPEQISGEPVGAASDVFSWASAMYYGAIGRLPFEGSTLYAVSQKIMTYQPDLFGLPTALQGPMAACLSKDPLDRPTAAQLMLMITG
ncbi:serine/threonine protein kinase [Planotetraspora sp. A-T 1434]|uniref:serine/threonine-protein kinase n=1 Tax=Planotetraspora sp. A-T 1434 TaxID=2979219 RepID=UPI0021C14D9B|nr:serine/threonine-protein kinase [Planotetraspora sp. A-T 1434]MCT9932236.1 serine/threonine protein kinase [Planotetraspora sp. A-T 1434]